MRHIQFTEISETYNTQLAVTYYHLRSSWICTTPKFKKKPHQNV